jgi:hypothetical protein
MPPYDIGVAGMLRWLGARVQPLAIDPGGTDLAAILWLCAAAGWVLGSRRSLGAVFALMPLSAFVFAALRLVPLYQRFSLWIAPAFYVGVALLVDRLAAFTRDAWTRRLRLRLAAAAAAGLAVAALAADVVVKGGDDLFVTTPRNLHRVDDHAAVEWLLAQRQPGDALMTTRLGWPALWWYGGIPIADAEGLSRRQPDGSAMYEMRHTPHYGECSRQPLRALLQGHRRVLVYMGFPDRPDGFDHLLLEDLAALGRISAFREFTEITLAVVVDLRTPDAGARDLVELTRKWRRDRPADLDGCVTARPVRRW